MSDFDFKRYETAEAIATDFFSGMEIDDPFSTEANEPPAAGVEDFDPEGITPLQMLKGIQSQGAWGFFDEKSMVIHWWASPSCNPSIIAHMLAHEVGHATGEPVEDQEAEEMRAEYAGHAAGIAVEMLLQAGVLTTPATTPPASESNGKDGI